MRRPDLALFSVIGACALFVAVQARGVSARTQAGSHDRAAHALAQRVVVRDAERAFHDSTAAAANHGDAVLATTAEPPPERDLADIRRRLTLGSAGTCMPDMLRERDSAVMRWPDRVEPLAIWVQPTTTIPDWTPDHVPLARSAFLEWGSAGIPIRFTFVRDSSRADAHVLWVDRFAGTERIGSTLRVHDQHWRIVQGEITLAVRTAGGMVLPPSLMRATALHEVGHLLGLEHCGDTTSIMVSRAHASSGDITAADRATARLLYTIPPGSLR